MAKQKENQLQVLLKEQDLAPIQVQALLEAFGGPFEEAGEILENYKRDEKGELIVTDETIVVTDESDTKSMELARKKRLALKKTRTSVENKRKELKENSLKEGRAIDAVATFVKQVIKPTEDYLQLQEDYAAIVAIEKATKIKAERIQKLAEYDVGPDLYNIDGISEDTFQKILNSAKEVYEARQAAYEKEQEEAEARRKAHEEEQERVRQENEKLQAELHEKNRVTLLIEHINGQYDSSLDKKGINSAQKNLEATVQALSESDQSNEGVKKAVTQTRNSLQSLSDQLEIREKELEERRKAEEENAKQLEAERNARQEAEAKIKAEQEAKAKAAEEDFQAKRRALLAPDKDKLTVLADEIDALTMPVLENREAGVVLDETKDFLDRIVKNLRNKAGEL